MTRKPGLPPSVLGYVFLLLLFTVFFLALIRFASATEAPGCGNQHYRPRLTQCCPKYLAGEDLPPKCTHALLDGFLDQCCGAESVPTPTPDPEPTCPPEWAYCPKPSPLCAAPTPLPTPNDPQKGACCKQARDIYRDTRRDIVRRYRAELRAVVDRVQAQMRQCREGYEVRDGQ